MKYLTIRNATRKVELGRRVRLASSLIQRAVGLLSTANLAAGEGMYLRPCNSIHTFFMRYPIDVLFLDDQGVVVGQDTYRPWRFSRRYSDCRGVVEIMAGTLARTGTRVGDRIEIEGDN